MTARVLVEYLWKENKSDSIIFIKIKLPRSTDKKIIDKTKDEIKNLGFVLSSVKEIHCEG